MTNDISIIIPVHVLENGTEDLLKKAIGSVRDCQKHYKDGKLLVNVVAPFEASEFDVDNWILNDSGDTSYCGQVNFGVQNINTKYFSVLEFDDFYYEKWFKFFSQYLYGNEDVTAFLPLNVVTDINGENWQYGNEMPLRMHVSKELGFIDYDCLQDWNMFTLAGSVINRDDFIKVGMYKPSIKLSYDYEFLLRATNRKLKIMVVPKEGYKHMVGRTDSQMDIYRKEMVGTDDVQKWFDLAKREYQYTDDRKKGISNKKKTEDVK